VLVAGLIVGRCIRQTGLGCFLAYLTLGPILYRNRGRVGLLTAVAVIGPLLIKRLTGNKPPARRRPEAYLRRLIYEQDQPSAADDRPRLAFQSPSSGRTCLSSSAGSAIRTAV
jgi:hypothetical protein